MSQCRRDICLLTRDLLHILQHMACIHKLDCRETPQSSFCRIACSPSMTVILEVAFPTSHPAILDPYQNESTEMLHQHSFRTDTEGLLCSICFTGWVETAALVRSHSLGSILHTQSLLLSLCHTHTIPDTHAQRRKHTYKLWSL